MFCGRIYFEITCELKKSLYGLLSKYSAKGNIIAKGDTSLKVKLNFETEESYDDKAKVTFDGIPRKSKKTVEKLIEELQFLETVIFIHDAEKTNINRIAASGDDIYVRECRKAWDSLWDYFGFAEYKEKCFPKGIGLNCTFQEVQFLSEYFKKVCRESQYKSIHDERETKNFLDKRKKNYSTEDKANIRWAAKNLYQMMDKRIGITEDIQKNFEKVTKKMFYIEDGFDDIAKILNGTKNLMLHADTKGKKSFLAKKKERYCSYSLKKI